MVPPGFRTAMKDERGSYQQQRIHQRQAALSSTRRANERQPRMLKKDAVFAVAAVSADKRRKSRAMIAEHDRLHEFRPMNVARE
jgi:hypothetical protein